MQEKTFLYSPHVSSDLPLDLSVFELLAIEAPSAPIPKKRRPFVPAGDDFPLATIPAPVVPDLAWEHAETRYPLPVTHVPLQPEALQVLEADFELPPESPELAWEHAEARYPTPSKHVIPATDVTHIDTDLFGTIDLHPAFWQDTNLPVPASRKHVPPPQPSPEILVESLYAEFVPFFELQPDPPQSRFAKRPWDWTQIASIEPTIHVPYTRIYADSLRFYFTGAGSDGGAQASQAASLGGYRSSTEAERVGVIQRTTIQGVTLEIASRANGDGGQIGSLLAIDTGRVTYSAPGGSSGDPVSLIVGEPATVADGTDPSKYLRVTRTSTADLVGVSTLEFSDQYNNVFAFSDADNAESTAGGSRYRAVMLRCHSMASVEGVKLYLKTLGTQTVAAGGGLPSSGAGVIGSPADGLADWPHQGWCRVESAGGTLKEIVYYSSRSENQLVVPALGRGRLGTSATLGAPDDKLYPVPGVRIAWEAASPRVGGSVQSIADETTAPTGLSWSTAITAAAGVNAGTLHTAELGALWIHRELPASVSAYSQHETAVLCQYTVEGETYTETLAGRWRIAVDASRRLELRIGVGQLPDPEADPDETETVPTGTTPEAHLTANPWTTTAELNDDATNYISVNFRNEYGLASEAILTHTITVSGGSVVTDPPSAPVIQTLTPAASGAFRLTAVYFYEQDTSAQRADQWLVYLTTDGSTPDPSVHTPTVVSLSAVGDGAAFLDWTSGTFSNGTVGRALVRVRRSSDTSDSASSDVLTATASTAGPSSITGGLFYRKQAEG